MIGSIITREIGRTAYRARWQAYMNSREWRERRQRVFARDGWSCQRCGRRRRLQGHHHTYPPSPEQDRDENIVTLCRACHHAKHRPRPPAIQLLIALAAIVIFALVLWLGP